MRHCVQQDETLSGLLGVSDGIEHFIQGAFDQYAQLGVPFRESLQMFVGAVRSGRAAAKIQEASNPSPSEISSMIAATEELVDGGVAAS